MAMDPITLHTAKRTVAIRPRSPKHRATLVREAAERDGWAYATSRRYTARIVVEAFGPCNMRIGQAHLDLDLYSEAETALARGEEG